MSRDRRNQRGVLSLDVEVVDLVSVFLSDPFIREKKKMAKEMETSRKEKREKRKESRKARKGG